MSLWGDSRFPLFFCHYVVDFSVEASGQCGVNIEQLVLEEDEPLDSTLYGQYKLSMIDL